MTDEQAPVRGLADFPEDLTSVDGKQMDNLKAKILKDFERLDSKENLDAEEMEHLAALSNQLKSIRSEEGVRAEKKAESDAIREQIRREMSGEAETDESAEAEEATDENAETETVAEAVDPAAVEVTDEQAETDAGDQVIETIAASVAQRLGKTRAPARTAPRPVPSTKMRESNYGGVAIVASSDTPGVSMGSHLSADALSEALVKRARSMGDSRGSGTKAIVASVERTNPRNDIRSLRGDQEITEAWNKAHDASALVASGGWCSPSETMYDFACDYESMPSTVDLPTLTANRGGVRVPDALKLSDFINEPGIGMEWTEATDILAADTTTNPTAVKVCASIPCPTFDEVRLEAFYTCLKAGNLVDRSWPELVNRSRDLALTAHAHRLNAARITKMAAASTAIAPTFAGVAPDTTLSATEAVLSGLDFALARFRDAEFTSDTFTLEAVAPRWLRHVIRRDLARRAGVPFDQVSDADINGYFAELGIRIQFVTNYQMLAANAVVYPSTVEIMIFPAGAFTLLDGGSLDLAVIRDSVLNETNDHTLLFMEEFWQLLNRCASFKMTIPICPDGSTGTAAQIVCPTV